MNNILDFEEFRAKNQGKRIADRIEERGYMSAEDATRAWLDRSSEEMEEMAQTRLHVATAHLSPVVQQQILDDQPLLDKVNKQFDEEFGLSHFLSDYKL